MATGGRPFVPPCAGTEKDGVFTLRTLDDAVAIKTYAQGVSTAVVIGGGLLGLETARALRTAGLGVTVVEFFPYLLPRQLDPEGAEVLQSLLEAQGLRVITGATTEAVLGNVCADCIRLKDTRIVKGDLVLFSTGIRSEVTLAQAAGLDVHRGIVVDDHLQTSAEDVFAAGDAAEFQGRVYGIIPPAIDQARVAAANMVSPGSAPYTGTLPATTLKVAGAELTSLGEAVVEEEEYTHIRYADTAAGRYRKLVLRDGHVVGAILLNDKERVRPITQLIERSVDVSAYADQLLDDDFDLQSLL
jgi:nitrite reductase (NADH) large subunit